MRRLTAATFVLGVVLATSGTSTSCKPQPKAEDAEDPPFPGCPFEAPAQESRCLESDISLQCEYGEEHRATCNTIATCTAFGWVVVPPDERCTPNDEGCPESSFEIVRGAECSLRGILCSYSTATCACDGVPGPGGSDFKFNWACTDAQQTDCPQIREHLGSSCFAEGKRCSYGGCSLVVRNITQTCTGGIWRRVDDECGDGGVVPDTGGTDTGTTDAPSSDAKSDAAPG